MNFKKITYFIMLIFTFVGQAQAGSMQDRKPFPPFHIAGNLYYVGNDFSASYLIVTSKGNILINSNFESDVPMIEDSIQRLGFKMKDIKILLISHAHADHDGGSALIKEKTGASYYVMDADVPVVESGGKLDFAYGNEPAGRYPPVKVDKVLHDGDSVKLGGTELVAHLTPGHTKGCTTWTMKVTEKSKTYNVLIAGGAFVNPDYKLINNAAYPNIVKDYEHMFEVLKTLPCDILLGAHGIYFDLDKKYTLMKQGQPNPFINPADCKKFVEDKKQDFLKELAKQKHAKLG